ncbi:MAG: hypothetical protein AB1331_03265 [Bacillota bacterium]
MKARVLGIGLLSLLLLLVGPSETAAAKEPLRPAILIPGLGGLPATAFGAPAGPLGPAHSDGLHRFLCQRGYRPGKTLFYFEYADDRDADCVHLAGRLGEFVARVRVQTGADRVDLVGHSYGGLVARYYVDGPFYAGDVANLIQVAPPNRGSYLAHVLKAMVQVAQATGAAPRRDDPEYRYIQERAHSYYLPLMAAYDRLQFVGAGAVPDGPPPAGSFLDWFARTYPSEYDRCLVQGQHPLEPAAYLTGPLAAEPPGPGQDLTASLYDLLAIQVAQARYLQEKDSNPTFRIPWEILGFRSLDWKKALYLLGRELLPFAADYLDDHKHELTLGSLERLFGIDPRSAAINRLIVQERVLGHHENGRLLANAWLDHWNAQGLAEEGLRRVIIAGRVANLAGRFWTDIGPNDLLVEVASAYLPGGREDAFRLYSGWLSQQHGWLTYSRAVQQYLYSYLAAPYRIEVRHARPCYRTARLWEWRDQGQVKVSPWEPVYVEIDCRALEDARASRVEVWMTRSRPGQGSPEVWLHLADGEGRVLTSLELEIDEGHGLFRGQLVLDLGEVPPEARRLLLGARLPWRSAAEAADLFAASQVPMGYRFLVTSQPPEPEEKVDLGLPLQPAGPGSRLAGGDGKAPAGPQLLTPVPGSGEAGSGKTPPVIQVIRRSKQTTHQKEDRTFHARWEWDFGDGRTAVDADRTHLAGTQSYSYTAPGTYRATARSVAGNGAVLRQLSWTVEVPPGTGPQQPHQVAMAYETMREAVPSVRLNGPKRWVTGRPAEFTVEVSVPTQPHQVRQVVTIDPGYRFLVQWARPGTFEVSCAVRVETTYALAEGERTITNTYVTTVSVEVLTMALTD